MINREFERKYSCCIISARPERPALRLEYKLNNIANPIVFDVDCIYQKERDFHGNCCDEFIFFDLDENTGLYLIERKSGENKDLREIEKQLQGGASFITNILRKDPALDQYKLSFMPILVSGRLPLAFRRKLLSIKIILCDMPRRIRFVPKRKNLPKIDSPVFRITRRRN